MACAGLGLVASQAQASGIAAARFGGEHGHPTTNNATAIYYNPAGLAMNEGTHVFIDTTTALRWASYDRPGEAPDVINNQISLDRAPGANDGKATLFNAILAPFVGVQSDLGTDFMAVGAALYFPFGGSAVWDKNPAYDGNQEFPGAVDGQQRWYSIDGSIRSMYVSTGVAFNIKKIGLSLGLTGSAIRSNVTTIRARNADGTDDVINADGSLKEGRSYIDVNGWQGGFGLGAIYNFLNKDKFFIGFSYQSQPNVVGGMTLTGDLNNTLALGEPSTSQVELTQTMPDILRLGLRYKPNDKYELRLFADYTRWSVFDRQCVLDTSVDDRNCDFDNIDNALDEPEEFGGNANPAVAQHLPRFWKDGGGVRFGASYWFMPQLEGFLGLGYDSTAVPLETMDPALFDMHKMSFSAGARWQIVRNFALALTSTQLFFFTADTEGDNALNKFQSPTRQPSAEGTYRQFFQLFNIYMDISFGYRDKGDKKKKKKKSKGDADGKADGSLKVGS